jgi:hypothetical protein
MTPRTPPVVEVPVAFRDAFRKLVASSSARRLEPGTLETYWEMLAGDDVEDLAVAARHLALEQTHFPTTGEWHAKVLELVGTRRRMDALAPIGPTICQRCQDTGAVYADCPGNGTCGRDREHAPHGFVVPCTCRATNVNFQRAMARTPVRGDE